MAMITQEFSIFFIELNDNNYKEWFHANKKRYEAHVKKPFIELLEQLLKELLDMDPGISSNPKDALFRINRDIRFSKDKTPYNTVMKAGFAHGGKRSELPGYYLGIDAYKIHVGGGLYNLKSPELKKVRWHIADYLDEFHAIINSKDFTKHFGSIQGEKSVRVDKELKEKLSQSEFIANKQFYAMAELSLSEHLNSDAIASSLMQYFKAIIPLNSFLSRALVD